MAAGKELSARRREKRDRWVASGHEAYPIGFPGRSTTEQIRTLAGALAPGTTADGDTRRVAGRVQVVREVGENAFLPIRDGTGQVQLHLRAPHMGEASFREALAVIDGGDIVGAEGVPERTRRGEPSLLVSSVSILAKALLPPPEKWHGLKDPEARLRQRYVDLFTSPETYQTFLARSVIVRELRRYLDDRGFYEVETPVLGRVASGAAARPFLTHYNYLDEDYKLRISLELPLKRLIVGGFDGVYEIGKVFRNEDLDSTHIPEFTEVELYWAYADYEDVARLIEGLFHHLAGVAGRFLPEETGRAILTDLTPPFGRIDFIEALERESGLTHVLDRTPDELRALAREAGARIGPETPPGTCLDKLFAHFVEAKLDQPTFVLDHPVATTPLAHRHRSKPGRVERFELYYHGTELVNAYSELNDPDDQEARFREQLREPVEEAYAYDSDFVEAMRYGMPPTGGLGFGIDRLVMALLGAASIKDVVLFPPTRARAAENSRPPNGPAPE